VTVRAPATHLDTPDDSYRLFQWSDDIFDEWDNSKTGVLKVPADLSATSFFMGLARWLDIEGLEIEPYDGGFTMRRKGA
jgi:hypothetical protein